ncbi:MAG: family 16 glycoside hydrolase [Planctomycetota bacterium]
MALFAVIAAGIAFPAALLGVAIRMKTPYGTLVLEISEPGALVEVFDEEDKVEITRRNEKGKLSISVDPGTYRLKVEKDGFQLYTYGFTIEKGGTTSIRARLEPLPEAATSKAEQPEPGFVSLFDGKTLNGWQGSTEHYFVEEGKLVSDLGDQMDPDQDEGNLFSIQEYGDFVLRLEFRLEPGANSGVLIRSPQQGRLAYTGMEIQILDDSHPPFAALEHTRPWALTGAVFGVVAPKLGHLKPAGQWNSMEILCQGPEVKITLNGVRVVDAALDEIASRTTPDGQDHPGLLRKSGYIGFYGYLGRGRVEYRNIRINDANHNAVQTTPRQGTR